MSSLEDKNGAQRKKNMKIQFPPDKSNNFFILIDGDNRQHDVFIVLFYDDDGRQKSEMNSTKSKWETWEFFFPIDNENILLNKIMIIALSTAWNEWKVSIF